MPGLGRILDASDVYSAGSGAERVLRTFWPQVHPLRPVYIPSDLASSSAAVAVTINDSRWVIVCPDCGEGQVAAKDDKRFCCIMCLNVGAEGRWRPVTWPSSSQSAAIEKELMKRTDPRTRGWRPGETVDDLRNEAMNQERPSVPRLEDLTAADQKRLVKAHNNPDRLNPTVEWADDARTKPLVRWPKGT